MTAFSDASRARLLHHLAAIPWQEILEGSGLQLLFVTLTYHEVPMDGRQVKRDLERFRLRWRRKVGDALGAWKLEFQRRGAAHFHLALLAPADVDLGELRSWLSAAWTSIVAPGDAAHLAAGTQLQPCYGNLPGYFAKYAASADKEYQHESPDGFTGVGRWWGLWGLKPEWQVEEVSFTAWCSLRRVLRTARNRKLRRARPAASRLTGLWVMGREERSWAALLAAYVLGVAPPGRPLFARQA